MISRYAELYHRLLSSNENEHSSRWSRQAQSSSVGHVFKSMAKSEISKLKIDVKEAKTALDSLVHYEDSDDAFALLMRGAVLGLTRFPVLAHIPKSTRWYKLDISPAEMLSFHILNETSWWEEFGICPTVGMVASNVTKLQPSQNASKEDTVLK